MYKGSRGEEEERVRYGRDWWRPERRANGVAIGGKKK